jgi:Holliday junction DNA helicase RuvA
MISFLRGTVVEISATSLVIDVSGVGYKVLVTPSLLQKVQINKDSKISVVQIIREDSNTLFGFADNEEREIFELLLTVNGIGPKLALTILAAADPQTLIQTFASGDEASLTRIPGVGKKSAARLILELKDKFRNAASAVSDWETEVTSALVSLGWSLKEATSAVKGVKEKKLPHSDVPVALKSALELLNRIGRTS